VNTVATKYKPVPFPQILQVFAQSFLDEGLPVQSML